MLTQRLPWYRLLLGLAIAMLGAVYQIFLASDPLNDQFMNVAWGREILHGHLPVRDFFEAGEPLSELLSAGAERLVGYRLLSEALLVGLAIGISIWLVFWVTHELTEAAAPSALAASLVVLAGTRSYSYPKVLIYSTAAALICGYVTRRSWPWLIGLSCWSGLAFLWRHDHGFYVALSMAFTIALAHGFTPGSMRRLIQAGAISLLIAGPYLAWVQFHRGLALYLSDGLNVIGGEFSNNRPALVPRWPLRRASDLVGFEARTTYAPIIRIRWSPESTPVQRQATLQQFDLMDTGVSEPDVVMVRLLNPSRQNIRALVNDPIVVDTDGLDRRTSTMTWKSWGPITRARFRFGLLRLRPFPAFDNAESAGEVAAWMFIALAAATLGWACWPRESRRPSATIKRAALGLIAGLLLISMPGLIARHPLEVYVPDVVALPAILAGCAFWAVWHAVAHQTAPVKILNRVAVVAVAALLVFAVSGVGRVERRLVMVTDRHAWRDAWQQLTVTPPVSFWDGKPANVTIELARYVRTCTAPDAPLLVISFAPEVHYYADRRLGSRHLLLGNGRWTSREDQEASLAQLRQSPPPIVIAQLPFYEWDFPRAYPLLADYIRNEYRTEISIADVDDRRYIVLTRKDLTPARLEAEHGWPCFTSLETS